jgi:Uma2 family endonuclease
MVIETLTRTYTVEEFLELDLPDDNWYELIKGDIVAKRDKKQPGPSKEHGDIVSRLDFYLQEFAGVGSGGKNSGKVYSGAACIVSDISYSIPDVMFLDRSRIPTGEDDSLPYPDLAVEVVSKSDIWFRVREKATEYIKAGTKIVWVVFYPDKLVFVYRPNQDHPVVLNSKDELDGENVLPGFKLAVSKLFD